MRVIIVCLLFLVLLSHVLKIGPELETRVQLFMSTSEKANTEDQVQAEEINTQQQVQISVCFPFI